MSVRISSALFYFVSFVFLNKRAFILLFQIVQNTFNHRHLQHLKNKIINKATQLLPATFNRQLNN
jgi:hypothetical protein